MKEYFIKSVVNDVLPEWATINERGELKLDISFQFQLEWEQTFLKMWSELTYTEQDSIVSIQPPYTEKSVSEFLSLLKDTHKKRGLITRMGSVLPRGRRNKEFPIQAIQEMEKITEMLRDYASIMVEIPGKKYSIGKYQVTQALWESVMGNNPSRFKGRSRPVEVVSWFDCVEFCNKLSEKEGLDKAYRINGREVECNFDSEGYRLPTEWEWWFAAKANDDFKYSGSNNINKVAWHRGNSNYETHAVGQKKANGFGLYDMSGNVDEWCWDICRAPADRKSVV